MDADRLVQENIGLAERLAHIMAARTRNIGLNIDDHHSEALLGLLRAARKYNPEIADFKAYATRAIVNAMMTGVRKWLCKKKKQVPMSDDFEAESHYRQIFDSDSLDWFKNVRDGLPLRERIVLVLLVNEGMGPADVARAMGIAKPRVSELKTSAFRAIRKKYSA